MYKMVNGQQVQCSAGEQAAIQADWDNSALPASRAAPVVRGKYIPPDLIDDFLGGGATTGIIGNLGWSFAQVSSGTLSGSAGVTNHPGIVTLGVPAVTSAISRIFLATAGGSNGPFLAQDVNLARFVFNISGTIDSNLRFFIGLSASSPTGLAGSQPTAMLGITNYSDASWTTGTTAYQIHTRNSSASTITKSNVTIASGTWIQLDIIRLSSGINYFLNGVWIAEHTSNIATGAMIPSVSLATASATARTLNLDCVNIDLTIPTLRY